MIYNMYVNSKVENALYSSEHGTFVKSNHLMGSKYIHQISSQTTMFFSISVCDFYIQTLVYKWVFRDNVVWRMWQFWEETKIMEIIVNQGYSKSQATLT